MPRILLVDDEEIYTELYVRALEARGFAVTRCDGPRSAKLELTSDADFALFVIDLMMPAQGEYTPDKTEGNLYTGACLALDLAEARPSTPIIIFTVSRIKAQLTTLRTRLRPLTDVFVLQKGKLEPIELAEAIDMLLNEDRAPDQSTNVLIKFFDSLILQPNMFGCGIDLKKLLG